MEVNELIKDIKKQFRLYMNGVVSQSMREKGLDYKLNFGIEVPRIKEIAASTKRITIWPKHCGKRISANVKSWQACFNR
jgi:hypothetical protein